MVVAIAELRAVCPIAELRLVCPRAERELASYPGLCAAMKELVRGTVLFFSVALLNNNNPCGENNVTIITSAITAVKLKYARLSSISLRLVC